MEIKVVSCPVCLENLNVDVLYCSDGYLYHRKCFDGLDFKSPITREKSHFGYLWKELMII